MTGLTLVLDTVVITAMQCSDLKLSVSVNIKLINLEPGLTTAMSKSGYILDFRVIS